MPPPISDLLRSRGGQTRTNNNNPKNDVLPLHNNNHNNNNNGTSVGRTASNVSTNNFLLGGMYVPNKDKRRQPKRRRVMGHNNNNKWGKCSLESIRQNVYIRYIFMIFLLVMFGMIISQQQQLEEEDYFDLAHQRNTYRNQHRTNHQTNTIDRLLQDTKLIHQLPSMQEEKKRLARRTEDRYKYQQQRQQKHFKLLEMLVPEWYHRNDPIRIIETTTKTAAIVESKDSNDGVVISESGKKLNHDTNKEQEITDLDGKSILENVIHVRPTSHRIRRTLQNNIHNMTQQLKKNNNSKGITKELTIATSSCPRNLSPTNITVSLLIQSSIDRLWILQETCQRWKAPIIVVVAVSDDHTTTAASNNSTIVLQNHIVQWKQSCAQLQVIVYHLDSTTESTPESYPVNTLRNVALDAVSTSHILMMDIDFIPSQRLDSMIQSALIEQQQQRAATDADTTTNKNEDTEKVAMVIPAFDRVLHPPCTSSDECAQHLRTNSNFIPFNFHELQQCYNNDECIIFQSMDNWEGHSSTRTELWLQQKWYADDTHDGTDPTTKNKSIRTIPCFDSLRYEPYVAVRWCPSSSSSQSATSNIHPVAPYYDERFHGYGKNKIQLISHLRLMGYKFTVLPNGGFIVHNPHVESSAKAVWNNIQDHQLHRTMDVLYQTFLNELVSIYLTGVKNGGTAPKNIVSACTTGHTSKQ